MFRYLKTKLSAQDKSHGKHKGVFAKYGHDCHMSEETDQLHIKYPGETARAKLKRCWMGMFIVSEGMTQSISSHLKSHGAVVNEQKRQLDQKNFIIHPYSTFRYIWDVVMVFVSYIQLIIMPLDIMLYVFPKTFPLVNNVYFYSLRMTMDLTCVLDLCLNFTTGYYDAESKVVVFDRCLIAKRYLKGHFVIDLLASLPTHIDLFVDIPRTAFSLNMTNRLSWLKILRYFILEKLFTKVCNIKRVDYFVRQGFIITIGIALFWWILSALHFYSALSLNFKRIEVFYELDKRGLINAASFFAQILYNGALLINSVTSGLAVPSTSIDRLNRICFWLASKVILIYVLAKVIQVMNARTAARRKYNRIVQLLSEFMRHKELPVTTQNKIIGFYEYHYQKHYYNEEHIMATISGQLRQEIIMHNCRQLVENVKFFKALPLVVLFKLVSFLHSETYMVNDVICRANTSGNCMYFISAGTVAVYTKSGKEVCHLHDGACFGEVALVTEGAKRTATVLAVEICEVYRLERKDFIRAICPYPDLLETIKKIAVERREDAMEMDVKFMRQNLGEPAK